MSEIKTEIEETLANIPGVDIRTISKILSLKIDSNEILKERGWKYLAEVSNIGEKKLVAIFSQVGETLDENEIIEYRENLKKHKVTPSSSPPSTRTEIKPEGDEYTVEDLKRFTSKVEPHLTSISSIETAKAEKVPVTMSSGTQTFLRFEITSDLEEFITRLSDEPILYLGSGTKIGIIQKAIINSSNDLVPTGARAHVKQWINLLESKVTGRRVKYSLQTMNNAEAFEKVLLPLIKNVIDEVLVELKNGSIKTAYDELKRSHKTQTKAEINKQSIINTIILYKIYIDAAGSNWDEKRDTGQLGVTRDDGLEFMKRMKDPKAGGSTDFEEYTIKRAWSSFMSGQAILLAGMPGSGKTYFSKAVGDVMTDRVWSTLPFTRINITGGLEPQDLIGEWDYQAQILALSISKLRIGDKKTISKEDEDELRENIYTIEYFRFGPLALAMIQGVPILIDEVNRGSADIQNTLLQAIDENELVIPAIGRIKATPGFFVMCTINEQDVGTTDLGAAFLRRVNYLSFDEVKDYKRWVMQEYPQFESGALKTALEQMDKFRLSIKKETTVSSEIPPSSFASWARELLNIYGVSLVLNKDKIVTSLGSLLKNKTDIDEVTEKIDKLLSSSGITR